MPISSPPKTLADFGDRVQIEMKRYGVPNEFYTHKVVNRLSSNTWVDVPVQSPATESNHGAEQEDVIWAICEGIQETQVLKYRVKDVKIISSLSTATQSAIAAERYQLRAFIERQRGFKHYTYDWDSIDTIMREYQEFLSPPKE